MADFKEAQNLAAQVARLKFRAALAAIAKHEKARDPIFEKLAEDIRTELKLIDHRIGDVKDAVKSAFDKRAPEILANMDASIVDAARAALGTDAETFDAIFGTGEAASAHLPFALRFSPADKLLTLLALASAGPPRSTG